MAVRLFQHAPTGRWLPIRQDPRERTPGSAYRPDLAREYELEVQDIDVVVLDNVPPDFETQRVPIPVRVPTPEQLEDAEIRDDRMPTFAEIDTLVETLFPTLTDPQRTFLKRLAKINRVLVRRVFGA